jgi:hypothetical protein
MLDLKMLNLILPDLILLNPILLERALPETIAIWMQKRRGGVAPF